MKAFAAALVAQIIGAAAVLLIATREWQTITTARPHPFTDDVVGVSGRTVDGAVTALALVALAGVVAIIATKGIARRVIGGLVAASGVALIWRIVTAIPAVDAARARDLVRAAHPQVAGTPHVATHVIWGLLSLLGAVLVLVAGLLTALRGGEWAGLSARYERREIDPEQARARADASLWTALERGDDPTEHDPREAH